MASLKPEALQAAFNKGFFKKPLDKDWRILLAPELCTVNRLLWAISPTGSEIGDLASQLNLHPNSVRIYLRWLEGAGLVESEFHKQKKIVWRT